MTKSLLAVRRARYAFELDLFHMSDYPGHDWCFSDQGIGKTRNGTEWNEQNEWNARKKFTHHCVTANVCVLTVCSPPIVPCRLQKLWMGSQESCL